jgi:hypothetical protein
MNTLLANGEVPGLFEGQYKFESIQVDSLWGGPKFIIQSQVIYCEMKLGSFVPW